MILHSFCYIKAAYFCKLRSFTINIYNLIFQEINSFNI